MQRGNPLTAHPREDWQKECICRCLAATDAFWNEVNYRRIEAEKTSSWKNATYSDLYDDYAPVISKATCQQIIQKNREAWTSYDEQKRGDDVDEPSWPGFWGNQRDGYDMKTVIRNDLYHIEWNADESTIKIPVGKALNDEYDIPGRGYLVELELRGDPRWKGQPSRLEFAFDEDADCFRVTQSVTVQPDYQQVVRQTDYPSSTLPCENTDGQLESNTKLAAIDVGANNTLSIVTEDGDVAVFHARPEFERFCADYQHIAALQSELPPGVYSSKQIRNEFAELYGRRDHHRDAAIKRGVTWLLAHDVTEVFVGDLANVLDTHWAAEVNQKTHNFWSHGQLTTQLLNTCELVGLELEEVSEAGTSSRCPYCASENVTRNGDAFTCQDCGVESHADVVGAARILATETDVSISEWFEPSESINVGSMARPAARDADRARDGDHDDTTELVFRVTDFQWNDHEWIPATSEVVGTLGSLPQRVVGRDQRSVGKPQSSSGNPTG